MIQGPSEEQVVHSQHYFLRQQAVSFSSSHASFLNLLAFLTPSDQVSQIELFALLLQIRRPIYRLVTLSQMLA